MYVGMDLDVDAYVGRCTSNMISHEKGGDSP